jgi:hypothetical protein
MTETQSQNVTNGLKYSFTSKTTLKVLKSGGFVYKYTNIVSGYS